MYRFNFLWSLFYVARSFILKLMPLYSNFYQKQYIIIFHVELNIFIRSEMTHEFGNHLHDWCIVLCHYSHKQHHLWTFLIKCIWNYFNVRLPCNLYQPIFKTSTVIYRLWRYKNTDRPYRRAALIYELCNYAPLRN